MSKIGFTTLLKDTTSTLSPHFGKAKWLAVFDSDSRNTEFVRNTGLNGRAMCDLLRSTGCEDVVFASIGPGALRQLQESSIGGWYAPDDIALPELTEMLRTGRLRLARKPTPGRGRRGGTSAVG